MTSFPSLDRPGLKRALWAYVVGHDRGCAPERKREIGEGWGVGPDERARAPGGVTPPGAAALPNAAARTATTAAGVPPAAGSVRVPERLDFHRGPGRWLEVGAGGSGGV